MASHIKSDTWRDGRPCICFLYRNLWLRPRTPRYLILDLRSLLFHIFLILWMEIENLKEVPYLKQYRPACPNLFISSSWRKKNRCPKTLIWFWIRWVITHAYGSASKSDCNPVKAKAHEVQRVLLLFSLRGVVQSGKFLIFPDDLSFYLKDVAHRNVYTVPFHSSSGGSSRGHVTH